MFARNLSAMGLVGLGPVGEKPIDVRDIYPKGVSVGERQRPLDQERVRELAKSILEHSQKQPIGVRRRFSGGGFDLIYGAHRLEAIKLIEREGWAEDPKVWAIIYEHDYPELLMRMDELIENLHRNELTPSERAAHQTTYAGLVKKAGKVQAADNRRKEKQKAIEEAKRTGETQAASHRSNNGQPTIREKIASDTGIDVTSVDRRHATAKKLAARLGVVVPSLEEATAEQLLEAGHAAMIAAQDKKDKARESGKPERSVDAVNPQKPTKYHLDIDVVELPRQFLVWCKRRIEDKSLTFDTLKATHEALGALIKELIP